MNDPPASHLIGAWLKGLFTCAHLNTRHLWNSKQRYQSMPFTSIPLLAEITLKRSWMLRVFSGTIRAITFHLLVCLIHFFQVELRTSSSHCLVLFSFSIFSMLLFSLQFHSSALNHYFPHFQSHTLKTFSIPSMWSIWQCVGIFEWIKMFLHNLQQCQRLRAGKIDTLPEEGLWGWLIYKLSPFANQCAWNSEYWDAQLWRQPRNHRWVHPSPCR